ncbi:sensor histidine kinase N-terminal domain-containing protein, partial [Glaciimonas sp. Cout2]
VQDHALLASARMISGQIDWQDGLPFAHLPPAALEIFAGADGDQVYYRVIAEDGRVMAGRPDFPLDPVFHSGAPRYVSTV